MWDIINKVTDGFNNRFKNGNDPFKIITRIVEECGELAAEVNHFEYEGVKTDKLGKPSKEKLAKEARDAIGAIMQIVKYYRIEKELEESFRYTYNRLKEEGWIKEES